MPNDHLHWTRLRIHKRAEDVFWNALPTITKNLREFIHLILGSYMRESILKAISAVTLGLLLSSCGGGEGSSASSATTTRLLPGPSFTTGWLRAAPSNGATLSGVVRFEISGYHLSNVRLLPVNATEPVYGMFNQVYGYEFSGNNAYLDLDTTKLPNGPLQARVIGYDQFDPDRQVELMSPRTWNINNASTNSSLSVNAAIAPAEGTVVSGTTRLEVRGSGLVNVELLPESGYTPKLGIFNVSEDRTFAWLDLDTRVMPDGVHAARISAFNVMAGQPGAVEVIAMAPRRWTVQNGTAPDFTARVLMAPVHGETVSGTIFLDVRGTGIENVELLPANGYEPKYGKFSVYPLKNAAYLAFDLSTLPPGVHEFRISAFNRPAGSTDAQEMVIMPARQWNIQR